MHSKTITRIALFLVAIVCLFTLSVQQPNLAQARTVQKQEVDVSWIAQYMMSINKTLNKHDAEQFAKHAVESAQTFDLDIYVFLALMRVESGFQPEAISSQGARGLTQVIPKYHQDKIVEARRQVNRYSIYEPRLNMYLGAWVLREYIDKSNDVHNGLLRYNGSLGTGSKYALKVLTEAQRLRSTRV